MPLNLEQKKEVVAEVSRIASKSISIVAASYRGLTVEQMNKLRFRARKNDVYIKVVPNTLAKKALQETEFSCLNESLVGPLVLAFALNEPGAAARLFKEFCKENENLDVKAIALGNRLLSAAALNQVAALPSRDEAISMLMAALQAPIIKFIRTLTEPHAKLVRTFVAVKDNKQVA